MLMSRCLYKFDNKLYLSEFLKDKHYYPKTYIYNKNNTYIPDDDNTWFIKKCAYGSYGGKDIYVANNYNAIKDKLMNKGKKISKFERITDHYRRFIHVKNFLKKFNNKKIAIFYKKEALNLSKFKKDNPHICRLILVKK